MRQMTVLEQQVISSLSSNSPPITNLSHVPFNTKLPIRNSSSRIDNKTRKTVHEPKKKTAFTFDAGRVDTEKHLFVPRKQALAESSRVYLFIFVCAFICPCTFFGYKRRAKSRSVPTDRELFAKCRPLDSGLSRADKRTEKWLQYEKQCRFLRGNPLADGSFGFFLCFHLMFGCAFRFDGVGSFAVCWRFESFVW